MVYTGFICGGFTAFKGVKSMGGNVNSQTLRLDEIDARWQPAVKSAEQRTAGHRLYAPEFYDFCYHCGNDPNTGLRRYVIDANVDLKLDVPGTDRKLPVRVGELEVCLAPFSVMMFSVRFDIDTDNIHDLISVVNKLRYVSMYVNDRSLDEFRKVAIDPIMKVYNECGTFRNKGFNVDDPASCRFLVENSNKFRLFQIASVSDNEWLNGDVDHTLFELGSMSRIGVVNPNDLFSPSKEYFQRALEAGRIDVFNNWRGLALYDTFTMLGHEVSKDVREYWIECNFKMLYTSQMFVKMYLTRLNKNFRMYLGNNYLSMDRNAANKLQNRYDEFDSKCWFDTVAYSKLPNEIYGIMGCSMEITVEKERLYDKIMRQNLKREKLSDQRMNKLLLFMTLLAMSSAIWDACCLVEGMYPFDPGESQLFIRVVTYIVLFVIFVVMFVNRRVRN